MNQESKMYQAALYEFMMSRTEAWRKSLYKKYPDCVAFKKAKKSLSDSLLLKLIENGYIRQYECLSTRWGAFCIDILNWCYAQGNLAYHTLRDNPSHINIVCKKTQKEILCLPALISLLRKKNCLEAYTKGLKTFQLLTDNRYNDDMAELYKLESQNLLWEMSAAYLCGLQDEVQYFNIMQDEKISFQEQIHLIQTCIFPPDQENLKEIEVV